MHKDLFFRVNSKLLVKVSSRDILYIEVSDQYSKIITSTTTYSINIALSRLEGLLPLDLFCRVNRSVIVPVLPITKIERDVVNVNGMEFTIGDTYKKDLLKRLIVID